MDLYQKNPQTLRKLLAKRQNPCTQIFKSQPSTLTSEPTTTMNLTQKAMPTSYETSSTQVLHNSHITVVLMSNNSTPSNPSNSTETASEDQQSNSDEDGDGAPIQEKLEKKVKPTPKGRSNHKSSYEEEREESTSCETHSEEGTANHEIPDFFLSPIMHAQKVNEQKLEEFRLDDDFNNSFFYSSCDEDVTVLKGAQEFAEKNEGICCSTRSCLIGSKLKFKCKFNHQWAITIDDLKKKWCPRCEELLKELKDFAIQNGGHCTNQKFDENISFSCHKGHSWKLNHKNAKKRWCLDCQKDEKVKLKKKCEEERAERQRHEEEYQRNLFEEARKKAMEDANSQSQGFMRRPTMNQPVYQSSSVLEYFQRMDFEIEKLAQKYTIEFMSRKEFIGDMSYQQILQVYKILIMPEEILQNYMFSLGADNLKSEFRRIAKIIHPDKNKHPQAGTAFQKIYKVYEVALVRIDAAQKV
jgi:hypothetical protein